MKKIVLVLCLFFCAFSVKAITYTNKVSLKSCIDGDTAILIIDGKETKVRLLAVNTPEYEKEDYGKEASEYTCKLLTDAKKITVEYDSKATTDKYDRSLVWIWVDEELLQERLVSEGYAEVAYVYDKYKYADSLCIMQQSAIQNKKNIWSNENKEQDYCGGVNTASVVNVIDYSMVTIYEENPNYSEEEMQKVIDQISKAQSTAESISDAQSKINNFLEDNREDVSNVLLYIILGAAGLYLLMKTIKDMKK